MDVKTASCSYCGQDVRYRFGKMGNDNWDFEHHYDKKGRCPMREHRDRNGCKYNSRSRY